MPTFDELPRSTQIRRIRRLAEAFLNGYRKVRPLSLEHEQYLGIFIASRIMGHTLWLAAHIGEPAFGPKAALRVAYQVNILKDFLKRSSFQTF